MAGIPLTLKASAKQPVTVQPTSSDGTAVSHPRENQLPRLDRHAQVRLDELMTKNNEGALSVTEHREFQKLGRLVERISLKNARLLTAAAG